MKHRILTLRKDNLVSRIDLADGFVIEKEYSFSPRPEKTNGSHGFHWWLVKNGRTVGYCKTIYYPQDRESFVLSEVEIRRGFRGQGLVKFFLQEIMRIEDTVLYSTGGRTPEGFESLSFLEVLTGHSEEVCYRSQSFVKSWDRRIPNYW